MKLMNLKFLLIYGLLDIGLMLMNSCVVSYGLSNGVRIYSVVVNLILECCYYVELV